VCESRERERERRKPQQQQQHLKQPQHRPPMKTRHDHKETKGRQPLKKEDREYIDITGDDQEPEVLKKWKGTYGSSDREIGEYLRLGLANYCREDVRIIEAPPKNLYHYYKIEQKGQCVVALQTSRSSHWLALCIDFDHRVFGTMGTRGAHSFQDFLEGQYVDVDLNKFTCISPRIKSQNESECGARVAVYCQWFAAERTRKRVKCGELEQTMRRFHDRVEALMANWRAARRAAD
jgi:hypothetical protein